MNEVKTVRIKMLRNKPGSPNGYQVNHYAEGEEYDVPEGLAKIFIEQDRVAELVGDTPAAEGDTGEKAVDGAPKNKAEKVAKNKSE